MNKKTPYDDLIAELLADAKNPDLKVVIKKRKRSQPPIVEEPVKKLKSILKKPLETKKKSDTKGQFQKAKKKITSTKSLDIEKVVDSDKVFQTWSARSKMIGRPRAGIRVTVKKPFTVSGGVTKFSHHRLLSAGNLIHRQVKPQVNPADGIPENMRTKKKSHIQSLHTADLEAIIDTFAKLYPHVYFPYPSPITGERKLNKKYQKRLSELFNEEGKTQFAFFILLPHHWTAYVMTFEKRDRKFHGEYFDSFGVMPAEDSMEMKFINSTNDSYQQILGIETINRFHHQAKQSSGTECGIFAIWFIQQKAMGKSFKDIENAKIDDKVCSSKLRPIFFS